MTVLMFVASLPISVSAQSFIALPLATTGRVIDVIDVDSIVVQTAEGQALVRLIGVSPNGSANSVAFLANQIMGHTVSLTSDPNMGTDMNRWNTRYVILGSRNINIEIVLAGYATINEAHSHASLFGQFQTAQSTSQIAGLGDWANDLNRPHMIRASDRININTASAVLMREQLDIPVALSNAIVAHRNTAPYQHLSDLSFVTGMTREIFTNSRHRLGISTNINTANEFELMTLGLNETQARNVVASRVNQGVFTNIQQIRDRNLITQAQFNNIQHFIAITDVYEIQFSRNAFRANLNTASLAQLTRAGATNVQANAIIAQRNILPIRSFQDVLEHTSFTIANINALSDNMRAKTNINTAPRSEIETLFGRFGSMTAAQITNTTNAIMSHRDTSSFTSLNQFAALLPANFPFASIEPFIYIGTRPTPIVVNVNRATQAQLVAVGVPSATAQQIVNHSQRVNGWMLPTNLPAIVQNLPLDVRSNLSVRTNINTATAEELMSLDNAMTTQIINAIMTARDDQPFGQVVHVRDIFVDFGQLALYNRIQRFLIVR